MTKRISGTREWAEAKGNIDRGCVNGCLYCYAAAMSIRFKMSTPESWTKPQPFDGGPRLDFSEVADRTAPTRVMFPTTHDIVPENLDRCAAFLRSLLARGHEVLIVSKPRLDCVVALLQSLQEYKSRVLWRFTIGAKDDNVLRFWEPGAPKFQERLESLRHAYMDGWRTSVSMEPMLDPFPQLVIDRARPLVTDSIWLGTMNHYSQRIHLNCVGVKRELAMILAHGLASAWNPDNVRRIYERYRNDPIIRWKDSIKRIVGLPENSEAGMDI